MEGGAFTLARRKKRLELSLEGTGRRFSLAKEPSLDPAVKRMAFEVKDAPPPGDPDELLDEGAWRWVERDGFATVASSLEGGKLHFALEGKRFAGEFILARTKKGWLLFKARDAAAARAFSVAALLPASERAKLEEAPLPSWIEP